jgi:beta-barrel assembly-enhancing protease
MIVGRWRRTFKIGTSTFLFAIASACASDIPPIGKDGGEQFVKEEQRLWKTVEAEERRLDESGQLYQDAAVESYVNGVVNRLVPDSVKGSRIAVRIKLVKNPLLNAFAYPNGVIYVHTGILARIENEAQLATLLGHEMTHATHRHALKGQRSLKTKTATLAGLQMLMAPFGAYGGVVTLLGAFGTMAAVTGYSRDLEREADEEGLEAMVRAGYSPSEAPKLFMHLKRDVEELKVTEPFFFGSHPRLVERIESYTDLIADRYAGKTGVTNTAQFMKQVGHIILDDAMLDLALGRFTLAESQTQRVLSFEPHNAVGHFDLGEVYRQRNTPGDLEKAEREFRQAEQFDARYAEPHRALGLIYKKQGRLRETKVELERYLVLAPTAQDRGYIEQYLLETGDK